MKALFAKIVLKLWRWEPMGVVPSRGSVVVCAPHTSNVDYLLMMLVAWSKNMELSWLGKAQLFKPPLGWLMRATGGIPVDRSAANGLVGQMAAAFAKNPGLMLAVPAEGTRSRSDYWKSGFYRIATEAKVPISLSYIDKSKRQTGFGPEFEPSGDLSADMDLIRDFYSDKVGLKPYNFGPIRLREESEDSRGSIASGE